MHTVNLFEIDSPYGNRTFKLLEGDLSAPKIPIDILLVSAYAGGYTPVPGSLLGDLYEGHKFSVGKPHIKGTFDLRKKLGTLFIPVLLPNIKHIIVVEMKGFASSNDEVMENVYLTLHLLETRGVKFNNIAFPALGTGKQKIPFEEVMHQLIAFAKNSLLKIPCLEQALLVSNDPYKTNMLNEAMNSLLGRATTVLPVSDLTNNLKREILSMLNKVSLQDSANLKDLKKTLKDSAASITHFAIDVRKLLEQAVQSIAQGQYGGSDLSTRIGGMRNVGVAPWIISYFHLLRNFSNEYAHSYSGPPRKPSHIQEEDLTMALFALQRVLDFLILHQKDA